jgi:hypothetical protein
MAGDGATGQRLLPFLILSSPLWLETKGGPAGPPVPFHSVVTYCNSRHQAISGPFPPAPMILRFLTV